MFLSINRYKAITFYHLLTSKIKMNFDYPRDVSIDQDQSTLRGGETARQGSRSRKGGFTSNINRFSLKLVLDLLTVNHPYEIQLPTGKLKLEAIIKRLYKNYPEIGESK